ncbi:MAG TPA: hypothetical protein VHX49_09660 [Candidatus Acidoferrales bacterium]|jgi:hypothetical protein|nr:hypothetical protein [Candidatus Acidoferrales bacterium]
MGATGPTLTQVTTAIAAVGALGTAAFGLVDASKLVPGLIPSSGFTFIRKLIGQLAPAAGATIPPGSALTADAITDTLRANWVNGMAVADQKSVAKTLLKLRLNADTAPGLATLTGVDKNVLTSVAQKLANGDVMTTPEMDTYGRFDILLSTFIDRAYQKADQRYRTTAKAAACVVAVILSETAAYFLRMLVFNGHPNWHNIGMAGVVGLIATPLAPVAKDLATALNTAAKAVQTVRR